MRTLASSNPEPLSQYTIYTYRYTQGNINKTVNMYDPYEIWYAEQHEGQWRDNQGNIFIIAKPRKHLPKFNSKHVLIETYNSAADSRTCDIDVFRMDQLKKWIENFFRLKINNVEHIQARSFDIQSCFFIQTIDPQTLIYTFTVKPKGLGRRTPQVYVIMLKINDNTSIEKARSNVEKQFIRNIKTLTYNSIYSDSYTVEGQNLSANENQKDIATTKSIANMQGWWSQKVGNYIFISDIKTYEGKKLIQFLEYTLPVVQKAFKQAVPPVKDISENSIIRIFSDPETYKQHIEPGISEWASGVWQPSKRELAVLYQAKNQRQNRQVITHEAFHQYLFFATDMIQNAPWLNEGFACFFQTAEVTSRQSKVIIPESDIFAEYILKNSDKVAANIQPLLKKNYEEFYEQNSRFLNYATAWSLIYFLQKNTTINYKFYESIIPDYLNALQTEQDYMKATEIAFRNINMEIMLKDFRTFWKKARYQASRYTPFENL